MDGLILPGGKNRAEVTTEKRNAHDLPAQGAKARIREAGKILQPWNAEYLGSAVIHYYAVPSTSDKPTFLILCHTDLENVSEGHASQGWKELKDHMMESYGRKPPRTRRAY